MSPGAISDFGVLPDGRRVARVTLRSGGMEVGVLSLGAILQSCRIGDGPSLVAGFATLAPYLGDMRYCGAVVGPVAGRIRGAEAMIGDSLWRFVPNEGRQLLHGGADGLHGRVWQIVDCGPAHVTLRLELAHCEGGFPGARRFEARYRLEGRHLSLDLVSRTDRPTLANLAPHAYWNLRGQGGLAGHVLRVAADEMLVPGPDCCPPGPPEPVAGWLDLRRGQPLGQRPDQGYDHCFCVARARGPLRTVAWLSLPDEPRAPLLEMATTEPGLQVYDAARHPGRPFFGVALESQCWPDAPRHAAFPSILLRPEDGALVQRTIWTVHDDKEVRA